MEQQHRNGRIVSGPHIHPRDFDFVFLDPGSSCGWCYKQKALSSSSTHHHSSFGSWKKKNTSCSNSSCSRVWKKKKKKKKRKKNTFLRGSWFRVRSSSSLSLGTGVWGWKLGIRVFVFEIGIRVLVFEIGDLVTWHVLPTWIHSICWCVIHVG